MQQNSATTHTHKRQLPHSAVGAQRVCNRPRAVVADVIFPLLNDADQKSRYGKVNETEMKTGGKKRAENSATTHTHKGQLLHTAVGAHRVCNGARAEVADVAVVAL